MAARKKKVRKQRPTYRRTAVLLLLAIVLIGGAALYFKGPQSAGPIAVASIKAPTIASKQSPPAPEPQPAIKPPEERPEVIPPPPEALPVWRKNAIEVGPENGQPMIAIVIDDMGGDHARSERAIALPAPLTMSFLAYAEDLPNLTSAARRHGHELMLHIPMQPLSAAADPGPHALTADLSDDEIRRRLDWDLDRLTGITGANNHMGSRFTEWPHGMEVVESVLRQHGLFVLDSRTTPHTVVIEVAEKLGVPHAQRNVFLDDDISAGAVDRELIRTEAVARHDGIAVAIGHPHDATLEALQSWLPKAAAKGFRLVPVSAIVTHNEAQAGRIDSAAD